MKFIIIIEFLKDNLFRLLSLIRIKKSINIIGKLSRIWRLDLERNSYLDKQPVGTHSVGYVGAWARVKVESQNESPYLAIFIFIPVMGGEGTSSFWLGAPITHKHAMQLNHLSVTTRRNHMIYLQNLLSTDTMLPDGGFPIQK